MKQVILITMRNPPQSHPNITTSCCFSHPADWLPTRKNYLFVARWPIPLVVCRTGKREQKEKVWQHIPPPKRSWSVRRKKKEKGLDHVLWDRNLGLLSSEIGPFSDFKKKSHLIDLESAHFQESDFQESGEVDRFLKTVFVLHGQAFVYMPSVDTRSTESSASSPSDSESNSSFR